MGHEDIETSPKPNLRVEFQHPFLHFPFRVLMDTWFVSHGAAKPQNPYSFIDKKFVVNADAAFRWDLFVFVIMVSVNIEHRCRCKCGKEGKVSRVQISAGNDKIDSFQFAFFKIVPQILGFFICYGKYFQLFAFPL